MLSLIFAASESDAQEYKLTVQNVPETKLVIKNFTGNLPVVGYSGTEIIVSSGSEKLIPPEKAKGLTPVYPGGTDNTGIGVSVEKDGSIITLSCLLPFSRQGDFSLKVPDNLSLVISSGCERSNSIIVKDMKSEIEIRNCHSIQLENVSGPLLLSSISGSIDVKFGTIVVNKPFSINSISGEIDITLPGNTPVSLDLSTISGSFYSDFDLSSKDKDMKRYGGSNLSYELNGGGVKFSIATISGNIYLRKGN